MKKVVIDARMVTEPLHGFARYVKLMAHALAKRSIKEGALGYRPIFLVRPGMSAHFAGLETVSVATPFLDPRELFEIPKVLERLGADLYHSPTFSSLLRSPCPWIITIHDLNHLTYGGFKEKLYYRFLLKRFAQGAKKILTVSEASRRELQEWLQNPKIHIDVVYNAIDPSFLDPISDEESKSILDQLGLQKGRYFFSLSNPKPHKNISFLVDEHATYFEKRKDGLPLVLSLQGYQEHPGVRALGGLSDLAVRVLLRSARALFFPSLYEGFGLPPVESVAMGVPIVVSQIAAHQEALQDLGNNDLIWLDPRQKGAWAATFDRLTDQSPLKAQEAHRARVLERYSLAEMGRKMDQIYREVLEL